MGASQQENGPYELSKDGEVTERKDAWDVEVCARHRWEAACKTSLWRVLTTVVAGGTDTLLCVTQANMIFVDQPLNVGFSYSEVGATTERARRSMRLPACYTLCSMSSQIWCQGRNLQQNGYLHLYLMLQDPDDRVFTEGGVAADLQDFLEQLFLARPHLASRKFFITGESYAVRDVDILLNSARLSRSICLIFVFIRIMWHCSEPTLLCHNWRCSPSTQGHYVPAVASHIYGTNKAKPADKRINLAGIAIGNGLTDPKNQYGSYAAYAESQGLISSAEATGIQAVC